MLSYIMYFINWPKCKKNPLGLGQLQTNPCAITDRKWLHGVHMTTLLYKKKKNHFDKNMCATHEYFLSIIVNRIEM